MNFNSMPALVQKYVIKSDAWEDLISQIHSLRMSGEIRDVYYKSLSGTFHYMTDHADVPGCVKAYCFQLLEKAGRL